MSEHTLPMTPAGARPPGDALVPIMLKITHVCELVQLSEREVRHRVTLGMFPPPVAFGRARRWHRPTLERWFAQGCPPLDRFERAPYLPAQAQRSPSS